MTDAKELAKAIKEGQDEIEIEYDLKKHVMRINATGTVAWGVALGAMTVVVISALAEIGSGGVATPVSVMAASPALVGTVATLGVGATTAAITMAITAGGVGVLKKLRKYDVEEISETKAILHRK